MKVLSGKRLTIGQLFLSLAAGLMLFLVPNEAKMNAEPPLLELYVIAISTVISLSLILIVKNYKAMGTAIVTAMVLSTCSYIFKMVGNLITGGEIEPSKVLSNFEIVSWVIIWFVPFVITLIIKMFSFSLWNTREKIQEFSGFLFLSALAFSILYISILLSLIVIPYKGDMNSSRSLILMPLGRIQECFRDFNENGIYYLLWHSAVFLPIGFFLPMFTKKINLLKIIIISAVTGIVIECLQYILNTGTVGTDDVILGIASAVIGYGLYLLINKTRSVLTLNTDKRMLTIHLLHRKRVVAKEKE